ncbi:MAG: hypothetical protein KF729_25920 [Sandaracinaceae bacterium]|nr:hypothetical protein [Sandaracinaceae bacterium]
MESSARPLPARPLVVVGDADGSLVAALGREGARASSAALHELGRQAGSHLVIVGKAAVDGGKHAFAQAPEGVEATVVLPRAAAAARMAACAIGARVVEPAEPAQLARAVIESLDAPPARALGWTDLGSLLDATAERVALVLGAERSRGLLLQLGDAGEVAARIDGFARELAALCEDTRRPDALGPTVAIADLSWDDDPQTQRLEDEEMARWRRLSARGAGGAMVDGLEGDQGERRSDVVAARRAGPRLPSPAPLPGLAPRGTAIGLGWASDPDIDETAPRPAATPDSGELATTELDALDALRASDGEARATVLERPPRGAALVSRTAAPPPAPGTRLASSPSRPAVRERASSPALPAVARADATPTPRAVGSASERRASSPGRRASDAPSPLGSSGLLASSAPSGRAFPPAPPPSSASTAPGSPSSASPSSLASPKRASSSERPSSPGRASDPSSSSGSLPSSPGRGAESPASLASAPASLAAASSAAGSSAAGWREPGSLAPEPFAPEPFAPEPFASESSAPESSAPESSAPDSSGSGAPPSELARASSAPGEAAPAAAAGARPAPSPRRVWPWVAALAVFPLLVVAAALVGFALFGGDATAALAGVRAAEGRASSSGPSGAAGPSPRAPRVPDEARAEDAAEEAADEPAEEETDEAPDGAADPSGDVAARRARSDALVTDGQTAERGGDWASARASYEAALAAYPANPHAHAGLARERLHAEDGAGALVHARRAASLRRRRADYQVLLGRAHRLAGDAPAARAAFDRALELDPAEPEALRALGTR